MWWICNLGVFWGFCDCGCLNSGLNVALASMFPSNVYSQPVYTNLCLFSPPWSSHRIHWWSVSVRGHPRLASVPMCAVQICELCGWFVCFLLCTLISCGTDWLNLHCCRLQCNKPHVMFSPYYTRDLGFILLDSSCPKENISSLPIKI